MKKLAPYHSDGIRQPRMKFKKRLAANVNVSPMGKRERGNTLCNFCDERQLADYRVTTKVRGLFGYTINLCRACATILSRKKSV